ncbi:hypothetical protein A2331_06505 [Candidatus Falkowbacteria bacterium RIFOXYB2_FULL_34_18]|uniref:Uncharacterized protein n=1 Tax=Candidatus Falkowbacteria bacterium RIFOXYD2_FULL_34_120 TaxID=1798007 RepID=A0A1F5TR66_9BACT|nr:MAG: hypothetical protein A2331_06505 [Candidatus Falkowbacteria bacterium RIFOXYB2_FULL_34_18]OGF29557.1 MAG: hypothetical protein A2500_01590 [Candidatus Falkowbacteria bacterium RIFOXYC12_FULL_34_55]OGF37640.1 MAG: hypothetical protein A2466_01810 [Candidatus Falkowbacteria bacterium RIFOXYC2_FULL_34_220]OGF39287.1 MAG: hypothetical protein A2515_01890 [Candidatus Falkowbacteria bacterium RIFOXYD12_FULL_34_57]OGF41425.1 MAG: hypothetical protein A2531_00055 [Candidatus Falkowbacteria bact
MNKKITLGLISAILAIGGYLAISSLSGERPGGGNSPERIVADYRDLLAAAEGLRSSAGSACENKQDLDTKIASLEEQLADLADRKKDWLNNVPKLPDAEPEQSPGRPGSEVPELTSDAPPLPEVEIEVTGSEVPELSSDVPPLPDIDIVTTDEEYIPELPEINTGRPGSDMPELSSDVPPLPEINDADIVNPDVPALPKIDNADIINPDEHIFQMAELERQIGDILQELKTICPDEQAPAKKRAVSDKCSDACQRHRDCAAYTEDATPADLKDAYDTCLEECAAWPKEMVKCINKTDIKTPNDCVSFLNCRLPQYYEEKYLP